jgi:Cu/Ag efflux protein CusF
MLATPAWRPLARRRAFCSNHEEQPMSKPLRFICVSILAASALGAAVAAGLSAPTHPAVGTVQDVDRNGRSVTIAHQPVAALGWPAMTMTFRVPDAALLDRFVPGRQVAFEFAERNGSYEVSNAIAFEAPGTAADGRGGMADDHQGMGGRDMKAMHDMCMGMMAGGSRR